MSDETPRHLDLENPEDAREFLTKALPEALPNQAGIDHVILESGRKLKISEMSDSEVVQYANELFPIYQAAFPDMTSVQYEH